MPKLPVWCVAVLLLTSGQDSHTGSALPSAAEFPPQDSHVLWIQREGQTASLAARRVIEAPDDPETVRLLAEAKNFDGVLRAVRVIIDTQPRRMAAAFEAVQLASWHLRGDDERTRARLEGMRLLAADARKRLSELPREEAARLERALLHIDAHFAPRERDTWRRMLTDFVERYRGTETALLSEVDIISSGGSGQRQLDALDAFVAAHPGTVAAAKALHQKAFQFQSGNLLGSVYSRDGDPTERFMHMLAVVRELQSGRYPQSEWVDKAPSLVFGFFIPDRSPIAPANVDRLLDVYAEFVRTHFRLHEEHPAASELGYAVVHKMADLFERKGDRLGGMEKLFANLEASVPDRGSVRYLRALFYLQRVPSQSPPDRNAMLTRARETLASLSGEGSALSHRRALATLAAMEFSEGNYAAARDAFRKYATAYPQTSWTWVAMLRTGQCEEELGDAPAAAAAYVDTAEKYRDLPLARVLGHAYAAHAFETAGEFRRALEHYEQALAGWDIAFPVYTSETARAADSKDPFGTERRPNVQVTRESLPPRIARLKHSLAVTGGESLERGRSLLARGKFEEAAAELQQMIRKFPRSAAVSEARSLSNRARLERALELANVEQGADEGAAMREFEALAREPHDFAVTAANIARASILWTRGDADAAERLMGDALSEWRTRQQVSAAAPGLEEDVAEIRRVVFLPKGGQIYGSGRWNAFRWTDAAARFALVNSDVRVKRHDGEVVRVTLVQTLPAAENAIFFDTEQIELLQRMLVQLGGTRRRAPTQIMETPNQPVGQSMQILRLWNKFFHARPGHWFGWDIGTYPVITEIEFTNADRTQAAARVTIGYSGATVELEKQAGKWIARRLSNQWIT